MKGVVAVIGVLILAGVAWFLLSDKQPEEMADEMMGDDAAMEMPADDSEGVDETTVEGDMEMSDDEMAASMGMTVEEMNAMTPEEHDAMMAEMMDDGTKTFEIAGANFNFSETELRVKEGDEVTINFKAVEGFHDWVVDEFDAATTQVRPEDGMVSVTFVADQVGEFEYYCSVGEHRARGMVGTLIVEEA